MSIINFETQQAAQQAKAEKEAQEKRNREVWEKEILPRYHVRDLEANVRLACEYAGDVLTLEKFEFMMQQGNHGLSFGDEREKILAALKNLLEDPFGRRMNTFDLETRMKSYAYLPTHVLRAKLKELEVKQELSKKSAEELKADLKVHRKAQEGDRPFPGFPTLLSTLVPKGEVQAVETKVYLNYIAKHDYESFKRYVRLYGSEQVTAIMQGKRY